MSSYINPPHNQIKGWSEILEQRIGFKTNGFFIEVGAFDGIWWSPSRTLAEAGWAGIFFEPQTRAWNKLCENYRDYAGRVECVKKALSDFVGVAELHLGGSTSTLREDTKALYLEIPELNSAGLGNDKHELVAVSTLDIELEKLAVPKGFDTLVIDVEGAELDVLNGFDIEAWMPFMVVIEAYEQHRDPRMRAKAVGINEYMQSAGYSTIYSDHINNIYILGD